MTFSAAFHHDFEIIFKCYFARYVNLLEPYMVQLVRIDFGQSCCAKDRSATIVVRVGNNRPDLGTNPICNR